MSCEQYKADIIVFPSIWKKIKPKGKLRKEELICGNCIFKRIEKLNKYSFFQLTEF